MAYTETTSVSWLSRLGSSFGSMGFGVVMILVGTGVLWWNEGNFVETGDALNEARAITQELGDINTLNSTHNGQLVHATGPVETKDVLTDPLFGVSANAIRLERRVEFYQWVEESRSEKKQKLGGGEETVTTYTYKQKWYPSPVNSEEFKDPDSRLTKRNFVLTPAEKFEIQATNVTFGAYQLPAFMINSISGEVPLNVSLSEEAILELNKQMVNAVNAGRKPAERSLADAAESGFSRGVQGAFTGSPQAGPSATARMADRFRSTMEAPIQDDQSMVHVTANTLLLGMSPTVPQIGDVRITFKQTLPGTVSIIAKLNGDTFEPYRASNGKTFSTLSMGTHSLENMYGSAHSSNVTLTWVWRLIGTLLVVFGLRTLVAPLSVIADVIPLLGSIVGAGTGLVSWLLGLAWSLIIIAIAWLRFRPLIGLGMIAVAVACVALLYFKGRLRTTGKSA